MFSCLKPAKPELLITLHLLNTLLGVLGLVIVWCASHSVVAVLGAIVASLHVSLRGKREPEAHHD